MPPSTRSEPQRMGMVRVTLAAPTSISLIESLIAFATYAKLPSHDDCGGVDAHLDVPGRPGLAIDQADRPRCRCPSLVNNDIEVLALRGPVAGAGRAPPQLLTTSVRSSSESLGSKGSVCTGNSRRA